MKRTILAVLSLAVISTAATGAASADWPVVVKTHHNRALKRELHEAKVQLVRAVNAMNHQLQAVMPAVALPGVAVSMPGVAVSMPGVAVSLIAAPVVGPMDEGSFAGLLAAIGAEAFENQKLDILRSASASNYFVIAQLERLLPLFTFENRKVSVVELLAPRTLDKQEAYRLAAQFTFNNSKTRILEVLR